MKKELLEQKVERLEKEVEQLKEEVYRALAIATGGVKTNVIYTYRLPTSK